MAAKVVSWNGEQLKWPFEKMPEEPSSKTVHSCSTPDIMERLCETCGSGRRFIVSCWPITLPNTFCIDQTGIRQRGVRPDKRIRHRDKQARGREIKLKWNLSHMMELYWFVTKVTIFKHPNLSYPHSLLIDFQIVQHIFLNATVNVKIWGNPSELYWTCHIQFTFQKIINSLSSPCPTIIWVVGTLLHYFLPHYRSNQLQNQYFFYPGSALQKFPSQYYTQFPNIGCFVASHATSNICLSRHLLV